MFTVLGQVWGQVLGAVSGAETTDLEVDETMVRLGVALAIGLLVGLQRQFAKREVEDLFAGARTFSLIGLAGGMTATLAERFDSTLVFAAGLLAVGIVVAVGHVGDVLQTGSIGLTTELAAIVTFLAGSLAGLGSLVLAVAVGVATTALLAAKPYTREFVAHIDREDVEATLQFAILVALVLPVLPRDPIGPEPFDAASPFNVGLMIVFILGLSFLGYVLIKILGPRRGIGLTGVLGGLVSSTAVTLSMSERSKSSTGLLRMLAMAILLAWTIMYARVLVEVGVVNPGLLAETALPIGAALVVSAAWAGFVSFRERRSADDAQHDHRFTNPFSVRPAIQFGLLYGVVLIGSKALSMYLGDAGVYAGAVASGLADVDAITLSMAELSRGDGEVSNATAANAIVLAAASNTIVKGGLVWTLSDHGMRPLVTPAVALAVVTSVTLTFLV